MTGNVVSPTRRVVRATPRFFEDLDRQLRAERGPNGEPSTNDFQVCELTFEMSVPEDPRSEARRDVKGFVGLVS